MWLFARDFRCFYHIIIIYFCNFILLNKNIHKYFFGNFFLKTLMWSKLLKLRYGYKHRHSLKLDEEAYMNRPVILLRPVTTVRRNGKLIRYRPNYVQPNKVMQNCVQLTIWSMTAWVTGHLGPKQKMGQQKRSVWNGYF